MQPLLSWAESKIFGGLHIVLCGWILFTPRRMMSVMLLCFLLSPSILKKQWQKQGGRRGALQLSLSKIEQENHPPMIVFLRGSIHFKFPKQPLSLFIPSSWRRCTPHPPRRREHHAPGDEQTWSAGDLAGWDRPCWNRWNRWNVKFWPMLISSHILAPNGTHAHGRSKIGCSMLLTFEVEKAQMLRCYQVDSTDAQQNPRTHWNHLLLKTPFRTAIYEKWPWNDVFGEHSHLDTRYGQIV